MTDRVTVLAGSGGNGGGGLCAARHLVNHGVEVSVVLDRQPKDLTGAAAHHHGTLAEMGVPVEWGVEAVAGRGPDAAVTPDWFVDALVGYGLSGPLGGTAGDLVTTLPEETPVCSLDVPSGLDATTGERPGPSVSAEHVVTLALPKTGLDAVETPVTLADIGVPAAVHDRLDIPYESPFEGGFRVQLRP